MKFATILLASTALSLGACASTQPPMAPSSTQDRWERIMAQMRTDSAAAAVRSQPTAEKAAAPFPDASMPVGVDLGKFELPVQYNERVQAYIDLYAHRRKGVFIAWLRQMGRFRPYIEERLAAAGLPRELVYLPLIESGYETGATSNASAAGLWQFMSGTARAEGLEVSEYVDERRDPFRSTDAAIRHLSGLYHIFDSWYLTAAAYNSGSGRIARLLKEYGRSKGADDTFWELQDALPTETRGYVPALLAAIIVGENPDVFGLDFKPSEPVRFESVAVSGSTELRAVARAAGTTLERIKELNPQFIRAMTPPDRESEVRVPVGAADGFMVALARIPAEQRVRRLTRTHVVKEGETLSGIAERYGTTVDALQKLNGIKRPHLVAVGRKLTIPAELPSTVHGTED